MHPRAVAGRPLVRRRRRHSQLSPVGQARTVHQQLDERFRLPGSYRLPLGYRHARDPAEATALLRAHVAEAALRADGRRTRAAIAEALLRFVVRADTRVAIVGHARLAAEASVLAGYRIARATVGNHLRSMEAAGVIGVAQRGCSAAIAGRNIAPVYVFLAVDALDEQGEQQLRQLRERLDGHHPVGVSDLGKVDGGPCRFSGEKSASTTPARRLHPERYAPRSPAERNLAVEWLAQMLGWPAHAYVRRDLHHAGKRFFAAGWTAAAIWHAVRHLPDGTVHLSRVEEGAMRPAAVLNARLNEWVADGAPRPTPLAAQAVRRGPSPALRAAQATPASAALPTRTQPRSAAALAALAAAGLRAGALR